MAISLNLSPIDAIASLITEYVDEKDKNRAVLIENSVRTAFSISRKLSIPEDIAWIRKVTSQSLVRYNGFLELDALHFARVRQEYLTKMRELIVVCCATLKKGSTIRIFGPGSLEAIVIHKKLNPEGFHVQLVDYTSGETSIYRRMENVSHMLFDLTHGLWESSLTSLFRIKAAMERELSSINSLDGRTREVSLKICSYVHLAFDHLIEIAETYETIPREEDLSQFCKPADFSVSLNVSSELCDIYLEECNKILRYMGGFGRDDVSMSFQIDSTLEKKYDLYVASIQTLKQKVILRHLFTLQATTRKGGIILFGDTIVGMVHRTGNPRECLRIDQKFPKEVLVQMKKLFSITKVAEILWPRTPFGYKNNLGLAYSYKVRAFVITLSPY